MGMPETEPTASKRPVWNAGRTVVGGPARPLQPHAEVFQVRVREVDGPWNRFNTHSLVSSRWPGADDERRWAVQSKTI